MICQWCHHETHTVDVCEWRKRPLNKKAKAQQTPGAQHLRARELALVRKNDKLMLYAMIGVVMLTALARAYAAIVQPPAAEELPGYMDGFVGKRKNKHKVDP